MPNPEDWPSQFTHRLNAGQLEAVLELYALEARFVAPSGEVLVGRDQIREAITELIRGHPRVVAC